MAFSFSLYMSGSRKAFSGIGNIILKMATASASRVLVVGATGYIGRRIVKASLQLGHPTYVLVRPEVGFDIEKVQLLMSFKQQGAKFVKGTLDDHKRLVEILRQVDVVISAMAGNHFRDFILKQLKLVDAIKEAGNIKRFLPSEFGMDPDKMEHALPPGNAVFVNKRKVRRAIEDAGIPYTYVSSNIFAGYLAGGLAQLGRLLPPEPHDEIAIYGDGNVKGVWVDEEDTGTYTLKTVDDPRTLNKTVYIRPPMNILSQMEMAQMWEALSGKTLKKIHISAEEFLSQLYGQPYEHQVGISHFYQMFFRGDLCNFEIGKDGREATELYPEVQYTTMQDYLKRYL